MNIETIESYVTEETYSAYEIAKIINRILKDSGSERTIKPQMMYNYLRNGMIVPSEKIFGDTLRRVTRTEVIAFIGRYVKRNEIEIKIMNEDQLALFDIEA